MSARRDAELKQRADDLARRESEFATAMACEPATAGPTNHVRSNNADFLEVGSHDSSFLLKTWKRI